VGYSKHVYDRETNNLKQWLACSLGEQCARNCVSILLPVSVRKRAKPDTAKVNGKNNHRSLREPRNLSTLLSCVSAEICAIEFSNPPSWISDFCLLAAAYYFWYNTSGYVSVHEYSGRAGRGVAVRISFPTSAEQEIYHARVQVFPSLFTTSGFEPPY